MTLAAAAANGTAKQPALPKRPAPVATPKPVTQGSGPVEIVKAAKAAAKPVAKGAKKAAPAKAAAPAKDAPVHEAAPRGTAKVTVSMVCGHRRKVVPGSAEEAYLRKTGLVQCRARHDALCYMALQKVQEAKVVTTNKRSS